MKHVHENKEKRIEKIIRLYVNWIQVAVLYNAIPIHSNRNRSKVLADFKEQKWYVSVRCMKLREVRKKMF